VERDHTSRTDQFSDDKSCYLLSEVARKDPLITKCANNLVMATAK